MVWTQFVLCVRSLKKQREKVFTFRCGVMASLPESPVDEEIGYDLIDSHEPISILRPVGGLDDLCKQTKFTRQEIRVMYRGFKQVSVKFAQFDGILGLATDQYEVRWPPDQTEDLHHCLDIIWNLESHAPHLYGRTFWVLHWNFQYVVMIVGV